MSEFSRQSAIQKVEDGETEQRFPSTVLPAGMVLPLGYSEELYELEQLYKSREFSDTRLMQKFSIERTANIGIHYFCVENKFALEVLAYSHKISVEIAELILDIETVARPYRISQIRENLLVNPIVYNNFTLFEKVFNQCPAPGPMLNLSSRASIMSVEVLLFLLPKARKSNFIGIKKTYERIFNVRKYSILAWIEKNNPELKDLPELWVLKTYDLYDWSSDHDYDNLSF
jgi:hypothetical protein